MTRLDRYLLSQLMALFGFFALVLVSVYWVNQAVRLFDRLISDGQTAWVVLEFTALTLPNVVRVVLPVAAFAAGVYAVNRASQDSELVVMQATGASPWRLAWPVAVFGLIVAVMMTLLVHFLVPASRAQMAERQQQVTENVTARFLVEGSFQHPANGVTIYIRQISELGELLDIFLSDARAGSTRTTYTAERALIVPSESGPKLVMFDGMAQTLRLSDQSLATMRFADFTYDIGALMAVSARTRRSIEEIMTIPILRTPEAVMEQTHQDAAGLTRVVHQRFAQPLLAPAATLLGFAFLMLGGYSRFGLWRQIGGAIFGLIMLQFLTNAVDSATKSAPEAWWLNYLPAATALCVTGLLLWWSGRPRRRPRSATLLAEGASA
ncbi:LPS export ABC transporter permease LptF [Sedimentimonas flavescens]|uniref:LPS export ABC transporter permease LptF n=1 Tax=Sedimentimonas flavescens TaxID=2851012 RepID=UPI0021A40B91|nr:LPS export ABC transporter permease LptF [Sedimentimonas flavescens]MCT2540655.1 LPS export ABC transporter permease LptF [Sedimentimonas flavescens]